MRARTIAVLVLAGVALLVVGSTADRGGEPAQPSAASPATSVVVTTRATEVARATSSTRATVAASVSTSSTAAPFAQGRQQTDRLEREQPLARALPHQTSHFGIDYRVAADGSLELTVRLFAVLNDADQLAQYEEQLRRYKAEALDFIRAQGEDPARYRIVYQPPDAARLGVRGVEK